MRIEGRRECAMGRVGVLDPSVGIFRGCDKRVKSSMKLPVARFDGVRGNSSLTLTSYACSEINSEPRGAVPQGLPSLFEKNVDCQSVNSLYLSLLAKREVYKADFRIPKLQIDDALESHMWNVLPIEYPIRDSGGAQ